MPPELTTYYLEDLCCSDEERCIRKKFDGMKEIQELKFDLISHKIVIRHTCSQQTLTESLREIGFSPRLHHELDEQTTFWQKHQQLLFTFLSGGLLFAGLVVKYIDGQENASAMFCILSMLCGWRIAIKGFKAVRQLTLDMNALMIIAAVAAAAIGKFEEGAAVVFLFAVSNILERYSMDRSRQRIRSLMDINPVTVRVLRHGVERTVSVEDVAIGERILLRPGERIPLDGHVVAGESTVDQSPITGESLPIRKTVNSEVFAGSLNERGALEIQTHCLYKDTMLARIVRTIEESQIDRAPIQTLGETFAKYYTPAVIILSILVAGMSPLLLHQSFGEWFYRALVLLVISCPCALVISTPVTILSGLTNAARHGVLIKGGRYLEALGKLQAIAFDKTGTLTQGKPRVTDIIPLSSISTQTILRLAAAIERKSEHFLADAVMNRASEDNISFNDIVTENFISMTGSGISASIDGVPYFIGNHALVEEKKICSPQVEATLQQLEREGKTAIILCSELAPLGIIAVADEVRAESKLVVRALRKQGIEKIIMLTGDNNATALAIAHQAGIDEYYAELLPHQKTEQIQMLGEKFNNVAMVGDGINDAPAMASSTIGIAMGGSGTDVALETADVVLMSDDIAKLPHIIGLSKTTLSIIKQNIAIALLTKLLFISLGIFGSVSLWMAVLADDGATLLVILNGLRALRVKGR